MKTINVYTDGACKGNPGPGGWASIILFGPNESIISGGAGYTTNNEMELQAVVRTIMHIKEKATKPYRLNIYTDSAYVCNGVNQGWIDKWSKNGWHTTKKPGKKSQPIKNKLLWMDLHSLLREKGLKIHLIKVKGHSDNEHNNKADKIACEEAIKYKYKSNR